MNKLPVFKRLLLTVLAATLFWSLAHSAFAAVQIPDYYRPDNLPDWEVVDAGDDANPEQDATQTIIYFVGGMISQVLLYMATIAIVFVILAGGNYILAFGKDERIERGKRGVFWSLAGLLIILLSYAIVEGIISILLSVDSSTG